jgi:thioredoxin reductase (NADPH)
VGDVTQRDLPLLHRLEERRLDLGRGPVDLVGEEEVREHRALAGDELPGLLLVDHGPDQVGGQQVGRELDAGEAQVQHLAQRLHGQGLGEAGDPLDQQMATAEEGHHHPLDQGLLADDDLADLVDRGLDLEGLLADGLVELGDVDLGHGSLLRGRAFPPSSDARAGPGVSAGRSCGRAGGLAPGRRRPLPQVPDLALQEGTPAPELRHVPAAQGGEGLARRPRQLRLAERLELPTHLLHLLRDRIEAAHVGRVQRGEQHVDAGRVGHPNDYTGSFAIIGARSMPSKSHYRVVILGSGPAGLTAALYASRAELAPLVVEGGGGDDPTDVPGGQLMLTTEVDNYPGFPEGILGPELMDRMRKQTERFGAEFATGELKAAILKERPFRLTLADGELTADALIVATGARAKWLGLPEELDFRTKIGGVSACATCDGFFYKGKEVLVVGGGDTAMEEADFLTKFADKVTVVHRRDELRASKAMQTRAKSNPKIAWLFDSVVEKILGGPGEGVTGAMVRNVKTDEVSEVAAGGIFMAIGHTPNTAIFQDQVEMDEQGYLLTSDGTTATSVPGVFAAGDVADSRYRQAVTAAGSGCMSAIDAERFLSH